MTAIWSPVVLGSFGEQNYVSKPEPPRSDPWWWIPRWFNPYRTWQIQSGEGISSLGSMDAGGRDGAAKSRVGVEFPKPPWKSGNVWKCPISSCSFMLIHVDSEQHSNKCHFSAQKIVGPLVDDPKHISATDFEYPIVPRIATRRNEKHPVMSCWLVAFTVSFSIHLFHPQDHRCIPPRNDKAAN